MANPQKRKGDRAELACAALVSELLGVPARRALGAGRADDVGDIHGVPGVAIQVADWANVVQALRIKPPAADIQAINADALYGVAFLRLRGGEFRACLTPDSWAVLHKAATA